MALRRRRLGAALSALAALLFLAVGCGPLPAWLLDDLQASYGTRPGNAWGERNAIVVLGAGMEKIAATGQVEPGISSYARLVEAATLQRDCDKTGAACKIVLSGGDPRRTGTSQALVYRKALLALGVAGDDLLIEPNSSTTWQHARYTSGLLRDLAADHVVLVSSGIHLRRSQLYFRHFGIDATQVRAEYLGAERCLLPSPRNFTLADEALHEYLDIARYHLRVALGEIARPAARRTEYATRKDVAAG